MNSITRNSLLTGTASLALAPGIGALATSPADAAPPPPPMVQSWAGWYIGVNIGGADEFSFYNDINGYTYHDYTPATRSGWAFIGGGQIGYNWQRGTFVYGLEADISGLTKSSGTHFTNTSGKPLGCCTYGSHVPWLATIRGRLGFTVDPATLVYATAGVAIGHVTAGNNEMPTYGGKNDYSSTRVGWVVGGGIEQMISSHWTIGVEGLFVDLGSYNKTVSGKSSAAIVHNSMAIARIKANYKF